MMGILRKLWPLLGSLLVSSAAMGQGNNIVAKDIAVSRLQATGTADSTTFLRGDGAWAAGVAGISAPDATNIVAAVFLEQFTLVQSYRTNTIVLTKGAVWMLGPAATNGIGGSTANFGYLAPSLPDAADYSTNYARWVFSVPWNADTNHPVTLRYCLTKEVAANAVVMGWRFSSDGTSTQMRPGGTAFTPVQWTTNTIANAASRLQWFDLDVSAGFVECYADSAGGVALLEGARDGDDPADTLAGDTVPAVLMLIYREKDE